MKYFAIYDIADPKRLARVAKILKDYGLRVQKSKFELDVTAKELARLHRRIVTVIDDAEDGVKYFPLCGTCHGDIEVIGQGRLLPEDQRFLIC